MSGRWRPYPAYKDSGVEWLGEMPVHWEVKRLRYACEVNPTKSEVSHLPPDTVVSFLPMEAIGEDGTYSLEEERPIERVLQGYTYFRDGDIAIAKITPCFENGKGAHFEDLQNGLGFGTTELHILRAKKETAPKFLFYLTRSHTFRRLGIARMYGSAGQKRVPKDFIRDFETGFPPLPEQRAIAAFLDRETAKIDALVRKQGRLIELLEEKRAALISHTVTKGLDPNVEMKETGVEWLGEIPSHWEMRRLRYACEANPTKSEISHLPPDMAVSFLPMEAIGEDGTYSLKEERSIGQVLQGYTYFRDGDIGIAKITPCFENGKGALFDGLKNGLGFGTTELHILRAKKETNSRFLFYLTRSHLFRRLGIARMYGAAGQKRVPEDFVRDFETGFPSLPEQRAIAVYLDRETARIDALIDKAEAMIERLQEYRTALISAAVTGKIDVRGMI